MIDFGLKPCPLCGREAEVARMAQGPEHQSAVIKCTDCGLTLEWETEIKVVQSRTGKRTVVKVGLDPIEAWNQRQGMEACEVCGYKIHSDQVAALSNCNNCGIAAVCDYMPTIGTHTRINCPLWQPQESEV